MADKPMINQISKCKILYLKKKLEGGDVVGKCNSYCPRPP